MNTVTNIVVWGSAIASLVLAVFLALQIFIQPKKRFRYGLLASATLFVALVDIYFSAQKITFEHYEYSRLYAWCFFGAALLHFFYGRWLRTLTYLFLLLPISLLMWSYYSPLASTVAVASALLMGGVVHGHVFWQRQGYASCVLASFVGASGLLCCAFTLYTRTGDSVVVGYGYAHYSLLNIVSVLAGWIHLPRELDGKSPVKISRRQGVVFFALSLCCEVGASIALLVFSLPSLFFAMVVIQLLLVFGLYFYNRHQLVIYTDNIAQLLDERTETLRVAQGKLAVLNANQAEEIGNQRVELETKAAVIERQRRLELAAQTAGQAAHDIRNVLTPILDQVQRLQKASQKVEVLGDQSTAHIADELSTQITHLFALNDNLLGLARRGRIERFPVNLSDALAGCRPRYQDSPVSWDIAPSIWVKGSWSQLARAIDNVLLNAIEANESHVSPEGVAAVEVSLSAVKLEKGLHCHLGILPAGKYVSLSIKDYGGGIAPEIQDQIFEPYFSSKEGGRSGSGLGLSVVTAVMEDHSGVLDLKTDDQGSVFTLYMPIQDIQIGTPSADILCGNETVLVAEDDSAEAKRLEDLLTEAGYHVIACADGDAALRVLQLEQVDLIITDLDMPNMKGDRLLFGALHLRPGVPMVVHSAFVSTRQRNELGQIGVSTFLDKPVQELTLLQAVKAAIHGDLIDR